MSTSTEHQIAAVEDNLLSLFAQAARSGLLELDPADDVNAYRSEVPIPLFNAISGARFTEGDRARALLRPYLQRGLPFMWWLTPSTTSPGIEAALAEAGLEPEHVPGMHAPVPTSIPEPPAGVTVHRLGPEDYDDFMAVCLEAFEFPDFARKPMTEMFAAVDPERFRHVAAYVDGSPAACGSVWLDGTTAGLYNIATMPDSRGRGLGAAVTHELLAVARDAGCTDAVLHATEMGKPVYERVGFTEVCRVPQWVWMPPG